MPYMYMYCFFKFLLHVKPLINSLTFKTENTKTLTYDFSSLTVTKIRLRHKFDLSLAFLFQYFSFLSISQCNLHTKTPDERFGSFLA